MDLRQYSTAILVLRPPMSRNATGRDPSTTGICVCGVGNPQSSNQVGSGSPEVRRHLRRRGQQVTQLTDPADPSGRRSISCATSSIGKRWFHISASRRASACSPVQKASQVECCSDPRRDGKPERRVISSLAIDSIESPDPLEAAFAPPPPRSVCRCRSTANRAVPQRQLPRSPPYARWQAMLRWHGRAMKVVPLYGHTPRGTASSTSVRARAG